MALICFLCVSFFFLFGDKCCLFCVFSLTFALAMHLQYLCSNNVDNGDNDTKPNLIKQKPIIGHHRFCIEMSKNEFDLLVGIDASTLAIC